MTVSAAGVGICGARVGPCKIWVEVIDQDSEQEALCQHIAYAGTVGRGNKLRFACCWVRAFSERRILLSEAKPRQIVEI